MLAILPVYLLLDVSASMSGMPLAELNDKVARLFEGVRSDPALGENVMLCVISFADDAKVEVPLAVPADSRVPNLQTRGGTNYAPAVRLLRESIASDIASLKSRGYMVFRPIAFFLTDGYPSDSPTSLTVELERLQESKTHPTVVAVGIGGVDPQPLHRLAGSKGRVLISSPSHTPAEAMSAFMDLVSGTLGSFVSSQTSGRPSWAIPEVENLDAPPDAWFS